MGSHTRERPDFSALNWGAVMFARMLLALLGTPLLAFAQTSALPKLLPRDQEIKLAESAAPAAIATQAAVYLYTDSGYVRARESRNGFSCLVNRDSFLEGYEVLKPTCWDAQGTITIVPQILYIGKRKAAGASATAVRAEMEKAFAERQFVFPTEPGIAYMLNGDIDRYDSNSGTVIRRMFPPHVMLYASGAAQAKLGMDMQTALKDARVPLVYRPHAHFAYIVVRVPNPDRP
jgi:hypothetical protein